MSTADRIAEITQRLGDIQAQGIRDQGNAQATAIANSGQIWSHAISNLGQLPGQVFGQMQQYKAQEQEQQIRQLQIQRAQQIDAGEKGAQALLSTLPRGEDGTYDVSAAVPLFAQHGLTAEQMHNMVGTLDALNTATSAMRTVRLNHAADLANTALETAKRSGQPLTVPGTIMWLAGAQEAGVAYPSDVQKIKDALLKGADPTALFSAMRGQGDKYKAKPITNETEAALAAAGGDPVASRAMGYLKPPPQPTETTLGLAAAGGDPAKALELLKGGTANAAKDDQRYEQIQQAAILKQPVSPEDRAWAQAYEKRKTIGPEATAAAAADRQAATIAQQTAQQARAQAFTESQAGKKEYTEKVAMPYQTALASAQTLRDTVSAAKGGNMVAANMQNLETAMAAIRSQGLNRINMSEIGVAGDAGSLWDRVQNAYGKMTKGQSVDAALQKDILQFADILEKSATVKYQKGRDSLLSTFKGMDLPNESAPQATAPTAPTAPTVGSTVMFQGKRYKVTGIRNGAATLEAVP